MSDIPSDEIHAEYRVLARKYRPQNFDDLLGQEPMVQTLTNAFETGRIAQAYMLTGVRGVGKTTTARILARALNYESADIQKPTIEVTQPGHYCQAIMEGRHVDVIEMDAASHTGIDDIRDLIESAQYKPVSTRYKVYIIDEVHMLSKSAFNGLLKTLEEPPEHLKFIFATTEIRKVPVTVLSRCQRFDLRRIDGGTMAEHLADICKLENVKVEEEALSMIARASEGSVRDALSMLDQAISHGEVQAKEGVQASDVRTMLGLADRTRVIELFDHVMSGKISEALDELKNQYDVGADPLVVLTDLADFIHFVTKLKYVPKAGEDRSLSEAERNKGAQYAEKLSVRVLGRAWQILLKGISEVQSSDRPLQAADMVLVRLTHATDQPSPEELIKKLQETNTTATMVAGVGNGSPQPAPRQEMTGSNGPVGESGSADPLRMVSNAGNLPQAIPQREAAEIEAQQNLHQLNSFEELIYLTEDKRDLALKTCLRRNVRLVSFSDGKMEFNLVGNPPKTFMTDLSRKLQEWTGKRWMIAVSQKQGDPTLAELDEAENNAKVELARTDPTVEAILAKFPGSKIIDVKIKEAEILPEPVLPLDDEDNLDDFF